MAKPTNNKKGISFTINPNIRENPYKSGAMFKSGGFCHPVAQGEKLLEIQPLGWIKNNTPIATVMCGTEINGAIIFLNTE